MNIITQVPVYPTVLYLWFTPFCSLGPAAFNVTAKVVSLSSTLEQINVTWTVSCTAKVLRAKRFIKVLQYSFL